MDDLNNANVAQTSNIQAGNQIGTANEPVDPNETIKLYKRRLLEDLKLDDLPENEKVEMENKIEKLVNDRVVNLILIYLPDDKIEEFTRLMETDDMNSVVQMVQSVIPNFEDKILEELSNIKDEILGGVKDKTEQPAE